LGGREGGGELNGVVGPEAALAGLEHGVSVDGRGQVEDAVTLVQMAAEVAEDRPGLGGGKIAAVRPPSDGSEDLDGGDAGDIDAVGGPGADQGAHPLAAGLIDMALDQGRRVEEIIRHPQRRSRMTVSERGSPLISTGASSGSSKSEAVSGIWLIKPIFSRC
jgi:hypothetical protein